MTKTSKLINDDISLSNEKIVVCALYKFTILDDYKQLKDPLLSLLLDKQVKGTLLLAHEGINGTIAGTREAINIVQQWLNSDTRFDNMSYKESYHEINPFHRTKVKLKKEIVTMGVENIDPKEIVGTYIQPKDWNSLISDPDVLLVDTRNDYEVHIGTFKNALNPDTKTFREFPQYVKNKLDAKKHKKVAMFCTGGIRCEKSTAFLKQQGFDEVYHLEGGILKYLEDIPEDESLWEGECFVFDNRVAVNHKLEKGQYDQCNACRLPITEEDKQHEKYMEGISCAKCYEKLSEQQKQRFSERQKQVGLAKTRGEKHIGGEVKNTILKRKIIKKTLKAEQNLKNQNKPRP
tara:strand:+ start:55233 stop:56276 length:1044 start_codon:yes stop_codon:yes gene_type:complete